MKHFPYYSLLCGALLVGKLGYSQPKGELVDQVAAVIGNKIVLQSEVQAHYLEYVGQNAVTNNTRCQVLEDLMYQKLLLLQAEKDSTIMISDAQVDQELNKRIDYFVSRLGSKEKFETFYGKTVEQFKEEYRPDVKEVLMAQQMRGKITDNITVTPEEVRDYYGSFSKDSIPNINAQVEIAQIVKMPEITAEEKAIAREKCEELRQRVIKGESIATLAVLYSDDPAAAKNSGEYKNVRRGDFVPEFDKMAFSLSDGEISTIFETQFGYHFMQLEKRHGELVDLRHILIMPKVSTADLQLAADQLDSIYKLVKKDSLSFSEAAAKFSDDKATKYNGGVITNSQTGQSRWDMDQIGQLDPTLPFALNGMNIGDISTAQQYASPPPDVRQGYRLIELKNRTKPHKANLVDDYQLIQTAALAKKQAKVVTQWINRKLKEGIYVHIDDAYKSCTFENNWITNP
jgi:peptidyl-prolyl cis-trans isomerase SurA